MGGTVPLGYDVKQRKLIVNQEDANPVNDIYRRYLELGSVSKLKAYLDQQGIRSKKRISSAGNRSGGVSFLRGALYLILQNRTYLGEVLHRDEAYPGEQEAIVPRDLWERVQAQLRSDNGGRRNDVRTNCSSLLLGLLRDVDREEMHYLPLDWARQRIELGFSFPSRKQNSLFRIRVPYHVAHNREQDLPVAQPCLGLRETSSPLW